MANMVSDRKLFNSEEHNETPQPPDRISAHLEDKVLLITGGTGFMGKVLIEKILRNCNVKKIYVLIRYKKGKDPQSRIRAVFSNPLFDLLKEKKGEDVLKKVVAIPGDVTELNLGLSEAHRKLLAKEVNIIYHFAATVHFSGSVKAAVLMNSRGTHLMLELAKECSNLMVFVHASTAYCHMREAILYEKPYPPPTDPHTIIKAVEWLDEDVIESMKDVFLVEQPNSYAFSKAIGESIAVKAMETLPVVILRFPVVVPTWREPLPGWSDNINGPTGLLIAAGKGVLRTMYCDPKGYADFLPVDVAANAVMVATYNYELHKERRIYNCTSSDKYKVTWKDVIEIGKEIVTTDMPFNGIMWYPGGSLKRSKSLHWVCVILFHYIPALLLDPLIWLSGNKPVLWRVQKKITQASDIFEYYTNNQWTFDNEHATKGKSWLNETEKIKYDVQGDGLDVKDYFFKAIHGSRLYILKEPDHTLPSAMTHLKRLWLLDRLCKYLIMFGFIYFIWIYVISPFVNLFLPEDSVSRLLGLK